ncbi:MAG: extracellular solute-binding protein, partial [Gammaproteobacteria bacterium]|nr:extracellular solute-binding protein [Gammaproteobacteria bacterium]
MFAKTHIAVLAAIGLTQFSSFAHAETTLNVASAGSQNMVDYVKTYLAPKFEATHPGVKVNVVGTGPGDAGSHKIMEKLSAQNDSGLDKWDIDVAVVHQQIGGELVKNGLLSKYRSDINTGNMVSRDSATNALGIDVNGYVMPMFHSQTAIAYN